MSSTHGIRLGRNDVVRVKEIICNRNAGLRVDNKLANWLACRIRMDEIEC
jgi:hypothetical protein